MAPVLHPERSLTFPLPKVVVDPDSRIRNFYEVCKTYDWRNVPHPATKITWWWGCIFTFSSFSKSCVKENRTCKGTAALVHVVCEKIPPCHSPVFQNNHCQFGRAFNSLSCQLHKMAPNCWKSLNCCAILQQTLGMHAVIRLQLWLKQRGKQRPRHKRKTQRCPNSCAGRDTTAVNSKTLPSQE